MSFVTNILTPIIISVFIGGFCLWVLFLIYKGIKKIYPNFNYMMKYKVFRRKYNEKVVEWCMNAISRDMKQIEAEKFLLIKGVKPKNVMEAIYIYDQVKQKLLEGGQNEQLRPSNEQTKLPEIS